MNSTTWGKLSAAFLIAILFFGCARGQDREKLVVVFDSSDYGISVASWLREPISVARITYVADCAVDHAELNYLLGLQEGMSLTAENLIQGLSYLSKKKKFATVTIDKKAVDRQWHLLIDITSLWTFGGLTLHGSMVGKNAYKQYYTLDPGDVFDEIKHTRDIARIRQAFMREGFFNATVEDQLIHDPLLKTITSHCTLSKGEQFFISDVRVEVTSSGRQEPGPIITTISQDRLNPLVGQRYTKQSVNAAARDIKRSLTRKGLQVYLTLRERISYDTAHVVLILSIECQGSRLYTFEGNSALGDTLLFDCVESFGRALWVVPTAWITQELVQLYHEHGFANVVITADEKEESVTFVIVEGEYIEPVESPPHVPLSLPASQSMVHAYSPIKFGKTIIVGDCPVPFDHLMRGCAYKQGQLWDPLAIKKSVQFLKDLEIFETVQLYPADFAIVGDERPVIFLAKKDSPYEVRLRLGAGLDSGGPEFSYSGLTYKVGGAFIAKNPFYRADQIRLDFDVTRTYGKAVLGYRRPWIGGWPVTLLTKAYSSAYKQPSVGADTQNLYEIMQQGILCELSHKQTPHSWGLNIGFEADKTKLAPQDNCHSATAAQITHALNFTPLLLNRYVPYFVFEPTVFFDYVDNKLAPHSGMSTLLSAKAMIPLGRICPQAYFIKFLLEQSFYGSFGPTVLAVRARAGYIFQHTFASIMPNERFYLGGAYSIRSYQTDMCPPLGSYVDTNGVRLFVPQGGRSMMSLNAELRFPLPVGGFDGVVFQDLGSLGTKSLSDFVHPDIVAGTGFGVRYQTPVGTVRFDIGWKWRKHIPDDTRYAWNLTLGQAF